MLAGRTERDQLASNSCGQLWPPFKLPWRSCQWPRSDSSSLTAYSFLKKRWILFPRSMGNTKNVSRPWRPSTLGDSLHCSSSSMSCDSRRRAGSFWRDTGCTGIFAAIAVQWWPKRRHISAHFFASRDQATAEISNLSSNCENYKLVRHPSSYGRSLVWKPCLHFPATI